VLIRETAAADRPAVLEIVRAAFGGTYEVELVQQIWSLPEYLPHLDLIAVEDDEVVGHVLCSRGWVGEKEVIALAPLCARPDHQRAGVGSALMDEVIRRADDAGEPLIGLLGHPSYYPRFGFERATSIGIDTPWPLDDDAAFMVRRLRGYDESIRGKFAYAF
jgi:predicted N-acetyltransferase YhbS